MKIYFNGDSYTYGGGLLDKENTRFSKIICDELDAEETNHAVSGCGNWSILRRSICDVDISEYDLAIINMSNIGRIESWDVNVGWKKINVHKFKEDSEHNRFWNYYMKKIWTWEYGIAEEKIVYNSLKNLCQVNNVPLILTTIRGLHMSSGRVGDFSDLPFDLLLSDLKYPRCPGNHPNEEGHQMITNDLIKIYENLL